MSKIEEDCVIPLKDESQSSAMEGFIKAVQEVFGNENIDQKSRLTRKNIKAIVKSNALNQYLKEKKFGGNKKGVVQVPILDIVCKDTMIKVISVSGKGREEVIKMFEATAGMGFESQRMNMMERMIGRNW
ncbi:hypothetical protein KO361_05360 [Candidatus Woesearchaeota archaeon]|jgi:hypothetical protein|nr:hypothetical protein [Candidatus Woesearchaeota archaeon]